MRAVSILFQLIHTISYTFLCAEVTEQARHAEPTKEQTSATRSRWQSLGVHQIWLRSRLAKGSGQRSWAPHLERFPDASVKHSFASSIDHRLWWRLHAAANSEADLHGASSMDPNMSDNCFP